MKTRKIIPICYAGWRVGSSVLSGFLAQCGAFVTDQKPNPSILCAKGSFEDGEMIGFQQTCTAPYWRPYNSDMPVNFVEDKVDSRIKEFNRLLNERIANHEVYAYKSMMAASLPYLKRIPGLDVRPIYLTRNHDDHALAIRQIVCSNVSQYPLVLPWLKRTQCNVSEIIRRSSYDVLNVTFEEILLKKIETTKRVCSYLDIEWPGEDVVDAFILPETSRNLDKGK
jgi:hypothetical protein